jgi:hypothetical protein
MKRLFGLLGFSILLSLYLTVIFILGRIAPFLFFCVLFAWVIIRQPTAYPNRADSDIKKFAEEARRIVQRLAEILTYPLTNIK